MDALDFTEPREAYNVGFVDTHLSISKASHQYHMSII